MLGTDRNDILVPYKEDTNHTNSYTTVAQIGQDKKATLGSVLSQGGTGNSPIVPNIQYNIPASGLHDPRGATSHTSVAQNLLDKPTLGSVLYQGGTGHSPIVPNLSYDLSEDDLLGGKGAPGHATVEQGKLGEDILDNKTRTD